MTRAEMIAAVEAIERDSRLEQDPDTVPDPQELRRLAESMVAGYVRPSRKDDDE